MSRDIDIQGIRTAVTDYLEGMIYGDDDQIRKAMHPLCMQAGHFNDQYEFFPREEFIAAIKSETRQPAGSPITSDIAFIDITGDIAIAKVTDDCFGTSWTDYLTLVRHDGQWQIVMKAFFDHANEGQT
jgi:hypothetical protein